MDFDLRTLCQLLGEKDLIIYQLKAELEQLKSVVAKMAEAKAGEALNA